MISLLGDLFRIFIGLSPYGFDRMEMSANGVPLLNIRDIENGEFKISTLPRYVPEEIRDIEHYIVKSGDVVLACRGTVLKVALIPKASEPLLISANLLGIRVKEKISGTFLAMYLSSEAGQYALRQNATSSTGQLVLRVEDVEKLRVPVPAPAEQDKLVQLWTAAQEQYHSHMASAAICRKVGERALAQALSRTAEE